MQTREISQPDVGERAVGTKPELYPRPARIAVQYMGKFYPVGLQISLVYLLSTTGLA